MRIAIDDFGTGFSSLAALRDLPVDVIQIDRAFVANSGVDTDRAVILDAILTMGDGLGLDVIADGIETISELDQLRRQGCHTGQGYLIARPQPVTQVMELIRTDAPPHPTP